MVKDKKILYAISLLTVVTLLALLFVKVQNIRIITALILLILAIVARIAIKKRASLSIHKREFLILATIMSALFVILLHISGIYFGYYKNPYFVNLNILLKFVLPIICTVITTELIRSTLIAQQNKLSSLCGFLSCVFAEILMVSSISGITNFNRFMDVVGLALFPAISANVYYHYASKKFGMLPNIVLRLITTLYTYFLPKMSAIPDALMACVKIMFPILMLALTSALYEKKKRNAVQKGRRFGVIAVTFTVIIILSISALISCQFRFGALVIATESMTGEINKGDVIIYERYDSQQIKEGQVIVFTDNKSKIVHRVVKIESLGGEVRYYTKGDANDDWDAGYRTESDIFAMTNIKLPYLGFPTLWLRALLEGSN